MPSSPKAIARGHTFGLAVCCWRPCRRTSSPSICSMWRTSSIGAPRCWSTGREGGSRDIQPAYRAKGEGVSGLCVGAHVFCVRHGAVGRAGTGVDQHELTFSLWLEFAECELLCGSFEKAEQLIVELLQRAASDVEFADASCLKINLHVLTGEHPLAIDSALVPASVRH
jgi:hypothetical protein